MIDPFSATLWKYTQIARDNGPLEAKTKRTRQRPFKEKDPHQILMWTEERMTALMEFWINIHATLSELKQAQTNNRKLLFNFCDV